MKKSKVIVCFEDKGQDFLSWVVENGVVVDSIPFQKWLWSGTRIIGAKVGQRPRIVFKDGWKTTLNYRVIEIKKQEEAHRV